MLSIAATPWTLLDHGSPQKGTVPIFIELVYISITQSIDEDIADFIVERQKLLDSDNRDEFSLPSHLDCSTSARTHPKSFDKTSHMKTAVIDNQDRLLNRSMIADDNVKRTKKFDAADERIQNLEGHLGIVTAHCDLDLYTRIKIIEDKILKIEQHYPQIAAHCFNYGRAEKEASRRPGGRVSKPDSTKKIKLKIPKSKDLESVHEIHEKMLHLKDKIANKK